jgi:hypothetical protein
MGNVLLGYNIDLSEPVSPLVIPYTSLSTLKCKEIYDTIFHGSSSHIKLAPQLLSQNLVPYFNDPKPLVQAFTLEDSHRKEFVNINYLISALYFYSRSSISAKARSNIKIALFGIFLDKDPSTLRLQELTQLIKSVILGVCCMTGRSFPNTGYFRKLAEEVMMLADFKLIKRINVEEYSLYRFTSFIKRDEVLMEIVSKHGLIINTLDSSLPSVSQDSHV